MLGCSFRWRRLWRSHVAVASSPIAWYDSGMSFHAVLFDLDGTLLDTLDDLADSANLALRQLGLPEHGAESYKRFIGDGIDNLVRRAVPEDRRDAATLAECVNLTRGNYAIRWAEKTRPYDGIPELLDSLTTRGIPMAVFSNKPDEFTQLCVERLLAAWHFEVVMGSSPALPKKPDPAGACWIAERFQVEPAEFVYLGDTDTDMQTAVAAGMYPVGALWGFRTAEELSGCGARALIHRPAELLAILGDAPRR
jgi:phosphoglycolate phosphatase